MDTADIEGGGNLGLVQRWMYTMKGETVDLEGPIYMDVLQQDRLLINGVSLGFKLFPNTDNFVLMSAQDGYTYEIVDCVLKVCHVKINPGLSVSHAEALKKSPAIYPYKRSDVKSYNLSPGASTWTMDNVFQGDVPSRVILALVKGSAYSGNYKENPFYFNNYDCNFVGFYVNGQSVPSEPLTPDYKNNNYISSYLSLFTGIGQYNNGFGNEITRDDYPSGYCVYIFNLDVENGKETINLIKKGHTRLSIRFASAPTIPLTLLVYGQFPGILQIDEARNILN